MQLQILVSNADRANSKFGKDGVIPEQKVWEIFACLVSELVPEVSYSAVLYVAMSLLIIDRTKSGLKCLNTSLHLQIRYGKSETVYFTSSPKAASGTKIIMP